MLMASLIRWVSPEALPSLSKLHGTHGSHQHKVYVCLVGTEMTSDDASDDASECMLIALLISWPACAPRATRDS